MEYRKLADTDIELSLICLGTMTWGQQNSEKEAHEQMDYAFENGINFFDTAELYPIPPMAETQGKTEEYIGSWFKKNSNREKIFLASKVAGRTNMQWFRDGKHQLDKKSIMITLQFIICCIIGIEVSLSPNPYTTHLIIVMTIYICLKHDLPNKVDKTIQKFVKGLKL